MLGLDKLYNMDCKQGVKLIDDNSIDLGLTDPPYGLGFMGKNWDKAIPSVDVWEEYFRVLKPGSFAFVICIPRQDCLSRMIVNLGDAGFDTGFTSMYWTFASGFPKSQNISLIIDKQECRKQLTEKLGRKPTKEEFKESWKSFREVVAEVEPFGREGRKASMGGFGNSEIDYGGGYLDNNLRAITAPVTLQAKDLDGSYAGFQPKPAVEIILVCMKPLSEKTYVDQALKNKKGITWLDDCRIPIMGVDYKGIGGGGVHGVGEKIDNKVYGEYEKRVDIDHTQGRFPANLLVSDDVLNDGRKSKSPETYRRNAKGFNQTAYGKGMGQDMGAESINYGDSGSFSRYFDLDAWWQERFKKLPKEVQKVYPFLIVPKASKSEKDKGMSKMPIVHAPTYNYEGRDLSNPKNVLRPGMQDRMARNIHPTCKPIALMSYLIILGSRIGDIVLDMYIGSGTTALAARLNNRHYLGFENNKEYYDISLQRLISIPERLDRWIEM